MQQGDSARVGPTPTQFGADLGEARHHLLVVGLVGEMFDAGAALGMVADRAAEEHDGAALRLDRPLVGSPGRQFGVGEREPVVAVKGWMHVRIVAMPTPLAAARVQRGANGLYALVLVEPGPLPPHERSWRHPSELGPTRVAFDESAPRSNANLLALAGGTVAVLAVAAMVVAMTPRTSNGPFALSATTTPITARAIVEAPAASAALDVGAGGRGTAAGVRPPTPRTALLTSFAAFPHAVTSGPQFVLDGTDVADQPPAEDDMVFLRTDAVTYELRWGDAQQLRMADGSVVFDADGDLVARVTDGELLSLVGG